MKLKYNQKKLKNKIVFLKKIKKWFWLKIVAIFSKVSFNMWNSLILYFCVGGVEGLLGDFKVNNLHLFSGSWPHHSAALRKNMSNKYQFILGKSATILQNQPDTNDVNLFLI